MLKTLIWNLVLRDIKVYCKKSKIGGQFKAEQMKFFPTKSTRIRKKNLHNFLSYLVLSFLVGVLKKRPTNTVTISFRKALLSLRINSIFNKKFCRKIAQCHHQNAINAIAKNSEPPLAKNRGFILNFLAIGGKTREY